MSGTACQAARLQDEEQPALRFGVELAGVALGKVFDAREVRRQERRARRAHAAVLVAQRAQHRGHELLQHGHARIERATHLLHHRLVHAQPQRLHTYGVFLPAPRRSTARQRARTANGQFLQFS